MPKINHTTFGNISNTSYYSGKILSLESGADAGLCTVEIYTFLGTIVKSKVPIYFHCTPTSVARANGSLEDAEGAFAENDLVIVQVIDDNPPISSSATVRVVSHAGAKKKCEEVWRIKLVHDEFGVVKPGDIAEVTIYFYSKKTTSSFPQYVADFGVYSGTIDDNGSLYGITFDTATNEFVIPRDPGPSFPGADNEKLFELPAGQNWDELGYWFHTEFLDFQVARVSGRTAYSLDTQYPNQYLPSSTDQYDPVTGATVDPPTYIQSKMFYQDVNRVKAGKYTLQIPLWDVSGGSLTPNYGSSSSGASGHCATEPNAINSVSASSGTIWTSIPARLDVKGIAVLPSAVYKTPAFSNGDGVVPLGIRLVFEDEVYPSTLKSALIANPNTPPTWGVYLGQARYSSTGDQTPGVGSKFCSAAHNIKKSSASWSTEWGTYSNGTRLSPFATGSFDDLYLPPYPGGKSFSWTGTRVGASVKATTGMVSGDGAEPNQDYVATALIGLQVSGSLDINPWVSQ